MAKNSHVFRDDIRLPPLAESDLLSSALWTRRSTIGAVGPSGYADLDIQVWRETQEDVQRGWRGVLILDDATSSSGELNVVLTDCSFCVRSSSQIDGQFCHPGRARPGVADASGQTLGWNF
jgi:hypothetical protein